MSAATVPTDVVVTQATVDRNVDLFKGYVLAQMERPERMERVPDGAALVLLPQGDPAGIEAALMLAADLARHGENVYLRHVDREGRPV